MNPPQPNLAIGEIKTAIQMLWAQGLKEEALKMEQSARKNNIPVSGSLHTEEMLESFITIDEDMIRLKDDIRVLEPLEDPVLIRGETGTGKEIIASALHGSRGPITDGALVYGKFVAVCCTAISTDLMMSELFGHKKGAFTGAVNDRNGRFIHAWKGTLFIDEIGDMAPSMQAALLRVLQEKVITPVGSNEEVVVNCRVIAATNKNLEDMVEKGDFRLDLLQRLNVFELKTKPLRERLGDISLMIGKWSKKKGFPGESIGLLNGNVRELQSLVRRWNVLGRI